ncbi:MAG: HEAT repeat domain-containing protein [Chloroflexota bacterium]|nr:MAG: HEAT repeat domain-containing protein [Chloroflexota bacterium]
MPEISELPFQKLIDALLDLELTFEPRYLYRLSDLEGEDLDLFLETWPHLPIWRRQALIEDLLELGKADDLLSFENIARNVIADEDPQVRLIAVQILWEFENRDLIPLYLEMLRSDPVAEVRAASASGLGRFVYLGEIDQLPQDLSTEIEDRLLAIYQQDGEVLVKCRSLEAVSYTSRSEISGLIDSAFNSGDPVLKVSAMIAMGRSMDPRWEREVLSMLNHKKPIMRAEAARAAGEIGIKEAVSTLIELTTDSEEEVRSAAIWSLSEIGGDRARRHLEMLFHESDDDREADFIESALDNIAFTNGMQPFSLLDLPEEDSEDELLDMLISQESSMEVDGNGSSDPNHRLSNEDFLDDMQADDEGEGLRD